MKLTSVVAILGLILVIFLFVIMILDLRIPIKGCSYTEETRKMSLVRFKVIEEGLAEKTETTWKERLYKCKDGTEEWRRE